MARNRKRRSEGRPRRPLDAPTAQPGVATARAARREGGDDARRDDPPDPIEHATPDVELAEAQLALGRPAPSEAPDDGLDEDELAEEALDAGAGGRGVGTGAGGAGRGGRRGGGGAGAAPGGELAPTPETRPSPRAATRLVRFLQGSWRELQRVQWPDRRQVMQATGVVVGFVIVAGVFLGVADLVASKVVTLILK